MASPAPRGPPCCQSVYSVRVSCLWTDQATVIWALVYRNNLTKRRCDLPLLSLANSVGRLWTKYPYPRWTSPAWHRLAWTPARFRSSLCRQISSRRSGRCALNKNRNPRFPLRLLNESGFRAHHQKQHSFPGNSSQWSNLTRATCASDLLQTLKSSRIMSTIRRPLPKHGRDCGTANQRRLCLTCNRMRNGTRCRSTSTP